MKFHHSIIRFVHVFVLVFFYTLILFIYLFIYSYLLSYSTLKFPKTKKKTKKYVIILSSVFLDNSIQNGFQTKRGLENVKIYACAY